jgi:hypothetical protein
MFPRVPHDDRAAQNKSVDVTAEIVGAHGSARGHGFARVAVGIDVIRTVNRTEIYPILGSRMKWITDRRLTFWITDLDTFRNQTLIS